MCVWPVLHLMRPVTSSRAAGSLVVFVTYGQSWGCVGKVTSARLSVDLPLGLFDQGRKVFLLLVSIIGGAHIFLSLFVNKLI